jgi:hypothetical protein
MHGSLLKLIQFCLPFNSSNCIGPCVTHIHYLRITRFHKYPRQLCGHHAQDGVRVLQERRQRLTNIDQAHPARFLRFVRYARARPPMILSGMILSLRPLHCNSPTCSQAARIFFMPPKQSIVIIFLSFVASFIRVHPVPSVVKNPSAANQFPPFSLRPPVKNPSGGSHFPGSIFLPSSFCQVFIGVNLCPSVVKFSLVAAPRRCAHRF